MHACTWFATDKEREEIETIPVHGVTCHVGWRQAELLDLPPHGLGPVEQAAVLKYFVVKDVTDGMAASKSETTSFDATGLVRRVWTARKTALETNADT